MPAAATPFRCAGMILLPCSPCRCCRCCCRRSCCSCCRRRHRCCNRPHLQQHPPVHCHAAATTRHRSGADRREAHLAQSTVCRLRTPPMCGCAACASSMPTRASSYPGCTAPPSLVSSCEVLSALCSAPQYRCTRCCLDHGSCYSNSDTPRARRSYGSCAPLPTTDRPLCPPTPAHCRRPAGRVSLPCVPQPPQRAQRPPWHRAEPGAGGAGPQVRHCTVKVVHAGLQSVAIAASVTCMC